jgi:predicted permease
VAGLLPMGDMAPRFLALFSIVTLLTLLVVSANIANLMLGRAVARQRETAVRRSLGASRVRVLRMLVAEGAVIALVGWAASCVAAWWTARLVFRILEPSVAAVSSVRPDWTLAAYAMLLAGVATIAFSAAPAARAWKLQVLPLLRSGEQSVAQGRSRLSNTLVVLQLAFSVLLLTSAGLAYRSLTLLDSGEMGFDAGPMVLATVRVTQEINTGVPAAVSRRQDLIRIAHVRDHLAQLTQVRAATYVRRAPGPYFLGSTPVTTRERDRTAQVFFRPVGADYLAALGLEPIAGRDISAFDRDGATQVAVINAQLAQELFPTGSALGQTLLIGERRTPVEVIGLAPNAFFDGPVHERHPRYLFVPHQQRAADSLPLVDATFYIRYDGTLDEITPIVSRAIADAEPVLPIVSMSTMQSRLNSVTILERQITTLLIGFALASLLIAALGQYAAAMFNMRRRTRDFGVRMALGATAHQIQRSVVREAFLLTAPGLVIGFMLSAGVATAARAALFGVTPVDPLTYVAVLLMLAATSVVASYLPAWRAGRVSVVDALRQE